MGLSPPVGWVTLVCRDKDVAPGANWGLWGRIGTFGDLWRSVGA